jgi:four helix bundle protein
MAFKFEQLLVWQKAIDLTRIVYKLTLQFPLDELFILKSQIKRASDSIALNIAEGSTEQTNAEFKKFLSYSIRSAIEEVS